MTEKRIQDDPKWQECKRILEDTTVSSSDLIDGLSFALRALCLTRDYVGEKTLPAIKGWEWYDAGVAICKLIPDDPWAAQFQKRIKR